MILLDEPWLSFEADHISRKCFWFYSIPVKTRWSEILRCLIHKLAAEFRVWTHMTYTENRKKQMFSCKLFFMSNFLLQYILFPVDQPQNSVLVPCVREWWKCYLLLALLLCHLSSGGFWRLYMCFTNGFFSLHLKIVNKLLKGTDLTHLRHRVNYKLDLYESTYFTGEGSVP